MLFPQPLALLSPFSEKRRSTCTLKPRAGTALVPPANRRVEFHGSGAPSGMMAQPQSAQGCAVCGAPSDPLDETREPAKRAVCRGRRLLVLFAKESGSFKSHSPQPEGRAKSCRGPCPRVLHGEAMPIRREGRCQPSGRPQKKPQP